MSDMRASSLASPDSISGLASCGAMMMASTWLPLIAATMFGSDCSGFMSTLLMSNLLAVAIWPS